MTSSPAVSRPTDNPRSPSTAADRRRRQQTPRPAGIEPTKVQMPRRTNLPHDQPGDQESRDDEEDIHPDIPTRHEPHTRVERQHQNHSHRTQTLNIPALST